MLLLGDPIPTPFDPGLLRLAGDLRRQGIEPSRPGSDGRVEYHQVRHGVWVRTTEWLPLPPVTRHAAFVQATALTCRADSPAIWSHESAAALWGMPRIEPWPGVAHVTMLEPMRSSGRIRRHECEVDAYVEHCGLRVTLPARTVVDPARTGSFETALAAADFAARHGLAHPEDLYEEVAAIPVRGRGSVRAAVVAELADGRSMSAGESLSRAQMFRLNLPQPDLQVACVDDAGLLGTPTSRGTAWSASSTAWSSTGCLTERAHRRRLGCCGGRSSARTGSAPRGGGSRAGSRRTPSGRSRWHGGWPSRACARCRGTPGWTWAAEAPEPQVLATTTPAQSLTNRVEMAARFVEIRADVQRAATGPRRTNTL